MSAQDIPMQVMPHDMGWTPCQLCRAIGDMCDGCVRAIESALVVELEFEPDQEASK